MVEEAGDGLLGEFGIPEACREADDPGPAPAGVAGAALETAAQGEANRLERLRGPSPGDASARIEAVEMRQMPVTEFGRVLVVVPFEHRTVRTDNRLAQAGQGV